MIYFYPFVPLGTKGELKTAALTKMQKRDVPLVFGSNLFYQPFCLRLHVCVHVNLIYYNPFACRLKVHDETRFGFMMLQVSSCLSTYNYVLCNYVFDLIEVVN